MNLALVLQRGGHAFELIGRGVRVEQQLWRLAQHFVALVAGVVFEGVVDKHDVGHAGAADLGDQHNVVEPRHAGLQQHLLLLRLAPLGDIAQVNRQAFGKRVGAHFEPAAQVRVKILELGAAVGG